LWQSVGRKVQSRQTGDARARRRSRAPRSHDSRRCSHTLADPNIVYLLLMAGLIGLYFEFAHPGVIFPASPVRSPCSRARVVSSVAGQSYRLLLIFPRRRNVLRVDGTSRSSSVDQKLRSDHKSKTPPTPRIPSCHERLGDHHSDAEENSAAGR